MAFHDNNGDDMGDLSVYVQSDILNGEGESSIMQEDQDSSRGTGHDSDVESNNEGSRRARKLRIRKGEVYIKQQQSSSDELEQEPHDSAEGSNTLERGDPPTRAVRRGRPPKIPRHKKTAPEASSKYTVKRLRDTNPSAVPPRRSARSASKAANDKMAKRSRNLYKTVTTQSKAGRKKATTSEKSEYEVDLIVAKRKRSGTTEYEVKWKGYDSKHNTWEPAANLTHCTKAVEQFNNRHK